MSASAFSWAHRAHSGLCVPATNQEARDSYLRKILLTDHWALCGERGQGQEWAGPRPVTNSLHSGTGFALSFLLTWPCWAGHRPREPAGDGTRVRHTDA